MLIYHDVQGYFKVLKKFAFSLDITNEILISFSFIPGTCKILLTYLDYFLQTVQQVNKVNSIV